MFTWFFCGAPATVESGPKRLPPWRLLGPSVSCPHSVLLRESPACPQLLSHPLLCCCLWFLHCFRRFALLCSVCTSPLPCFSSFHHVRRLLSSERCQDRLSSSSEPSAPHPAGLSYGWAAWSCPGQKQDSGTCSSPLLRMLPWEREKTGATGV